MIPGTEPVPIELARARHNLRRDHIRHRFTNLENRLHVLAATTHGISDERCALLERMLDAVEAAVQVEL